jgi:hypothetical protein
VSYHPHHNQYSCEQAQDSSLQGSALPTTTSWYGARNGSYISYAIPSSSPQISKLLGQEKGGQKAQKVVRRARHSRNTYFRNLKYRDMLQLREDDLMQGVKPVNIHNLTNRTLTDIQQKCLSFGIHFLPTPKSNPVHLKEAMKSFCRSMRLMWIYREKPQIRHKYHIKSEWNPTEDHSDPALERELKALHLALEADSGSPVKQNWPKTLRESLKELLADPNLLLITADKNLGYCLVELEWYKEQCLSHLNKTDAYELQEPTWLGEDEGQSSIQSNFNQLTSLLSQYKDLLDENEFKFITEQKDFKLMQFYITAKVHKLPVKSRPIVPTMCWTTHNISVWLSDELNPLVKRIPTILKDTTQMLFNLKDPILKSNCFKHKDSLWLVSCDVEALYPSMDIQTGLKLLNMFLEMQDYQPVERRNFLLKAAEYVLRNMYIHFNGKIYKQKFGAAMGSSFVPPYANIFMHMLEMESVSGWTLTNCMLLYRRFIDDIFMIINGTEQNVKAVIADLNTMDDAIRLTHNISQKSIDFLDITITLNDGIIATKAFQKAMNPYSYLPWNSYHSIDMKKGFIKGEAIRYARLCSDISDFIKLIQLFTTRLRLRGYPEYFITKILSTVYWTDRHKYTKPKNKLGAPIPLLFKIQNNPAQNKAWLRKCLNNFTKKMRLINHLPDTMKRNIVICQMLPPKLHTWVLKAKKSKGL